MNRRQMMAAAAATAAVAAMPKEVAAQPLRPQTIHEDYFEGPTYQVAVVHEVRAREMAAALWLEADFYQNQNGGSFRRAIDSVTRRQTVARLWDTLRHTGVQGLILAQPPERFERRVERRVTQLFPELDG